MSHRPCHYQAPTTTTAPAVHHCHPTATTAIPKPAPVATVNAVTTTTTAPRTTTTTIHTTTPTTKPEDDTSGRVEATQYVGTPDGPIPTTSTTVSVRTPAPSQELARTGSPVGPLLVIGFFLIIFGIAVLIKRNARRRLAATQKEETKLMLTSAAVLVIVGMALVVGVRRLRSKNDPKPRTDEELDEQHRINGLWAKYRAHKSAVKS